MPPLSQKSQKLYHSLQSDTLANKRIYILLEVESCLAKQCLMLKRRAFVQCEVEKEALACCDSEFHALWQSSDCPSVCKGKWYGGGDRLENGD